MSVEDLAIDVGLARDTDEFDTFVSCVNNILDLGCGYSEKVTKDIMDKCHTSELDIAKKVLRECRRSKTSGIRKSRLKWWESYVPKRAIYEDREPDRQPARQPARKKRRPMDLTFKKDASSPERHHREPERRHRQPPVERRQYKRPMSPMFERRKSKRPMSPLFERPKSQYEEEPIEYERRYERSPEYERRYERSSSRYDSVPRWPGKRPDAYQRQGNQHGPQRQGNRRQGNRKRRRYR